MSGSFPILRAAVLLAVLAWTVPAAYADDIEPGLWKITSRVKNGDGPLGPPMESSKCLTPEQTSDIAKAFSPIANTINSECAPIERSFADRKLSWRLVCKGQLDMELTGDFNFDSPRHYSATVTSKAAMGGMAMVNSQNVLEAERVSDCP
jgi:uncharacterized protein DUF3617